MFKSILVPFDGSSAAENALQAAIGLAAAAHAGLTLLYVLDEHAAVADMQMASPQLYRTHVERLRARGAAVLETGRILAAGAGVQAQVLLLEIDTGRVAGAICGQAGKNHDLVVMGTHGRRGWHRLFPGSDAQAVSRACPVPVLLVPPSPAAMSSPEAERAQVSNQQGELQVEPLPLPQPRVRGGMPLMTALGLRRSTRTFDSRSLEAQTLSELLWAAYGANRMNGDRTAPCWRHRPVIDVYVADAQGTWVYDPDAHRLLPFGREDIRPYTGFQDFVAAAAVNLIYVAHGERMTDLGAEERRLYASVDAAFIGQNVYLFCASAGLGTVFRGALDCASLARRLRLPEGQFVTFAQTVGYPAA